MAASGGVAAQFAVMALVGKFLMLVAALTVIGTVLGVRGQPLLLGSPMDISNADNDEGLQRALHFAVAEYNKANNDTYSSRVVRVIKAKKQLVSGIKYIMEVEIGRTTCLKSATDLQNCAFHDTPQMAKHTICNFVVYTVPWLNQIKLQKSSCQ